MQESNLLSLTRIGFRNQRITVLPILLIIVHPDRIELSSRAPQAPTLSVELRVLAYLPVIRKAYLFPGNLAANQFVTLSRVPGGTSS